MSSITESLFLFAILIPVTAYLSSMPGGTGIEVAHDQIILHSVAFKSTIARGRLAVKRGGTRETEGVGQNLKDKPGRDRNDENLDHQAQPFVPAVDCRKLARVPAGLDGWPPASEYQTGNTR